MSSELPSYVAAARPVPQSSRVAWYKSTAQTYAGIMLWFVFWQSVPTGNGEPGGTLSQGLGWALGGLVLAALLCHFLYYLVPGMLGLKTGLPLYIVGTSTYGTTGGFIMPGFLMGLLQFGWLGVSAYFSGQVLVAPFYESMQAAQDKIPHLLVGTAWAICAAFVGLKGIQYVSKVATYLPVIPLAILLVLGAATVGGLAKFDPAPTIHAGQEAAVKARANVAAETLKGAIAKGNADELADAAKIAVAPPPAPLSNWGVITVLLTMIIGFFATAGAAGTDFGMNNRDAKDVQLGGLVGIAGATIFAGGMSLLIVAGAHGSGKAAADPAVVQSTALMADIVGPRVASIFLWLLAIAAFPPACFSAFIAANSFKTTLPKVNPFLSVGVGTLISIVLVVTTWGGKVGDVFQLIGASFGPICGAMAADYLLAGKKWAGPRAGFNPAGWISWAVGFAVGASDLAGKLVEPLHGLRGLVPVPPLAAMIVGFVLYLVLAKAGLESRKLEMPGE
jgi:cytosine permease